MKKIRITMTAITAVLFFGLFIVGCSNGNGDKGDNTIPETGNTVQGKLIILQAYGNGGDGSPAGASHSFVELYNISDEAINLSGISLYYANGIRGNDVTEDEVWKTTALTGTIPAKGSFLILGAKHSDLSGTRYKITDGYGDINDDNLSLNRRGFKAAIIKGNAQLTVQNPFDTDGNGKKGSGYIDMVGALNNPDANPPDHIFGYETAPARNSASEAVRRQDLIDTDNNSTDFIAARYALTGDSAFTDEMLEVRRPRNSSAGSWEPFEEPDDPPDPVPADYSKLKLNEVSGVGGDSEKFYELINLGDEDIPLYGCKIYYNANENTGGTLPAGKGDLTWTGSAVQTIEAGSLFSLIGRNTAGSFTRGLTAARILIITLEDPEGNVIDKCIRAADTGEYNFTDKSFSRIPDGTGDFYFTMPTPSATNGSSTAGLTRLPVDPLVDLPVISNFSRDTSSVTPTDTVTVSATIITTTSAISTVVLQWTLGGTAQSNIDMTASGNVYSAMIPAQAVGSIVTYKVSATNNLGETSNTPVQEYTVMITPIDYSKLKLNEVSGVGEDAEKFYELKNLGAVDIPLDGCKIYYNANGSTGGTLPGGDGLLTWTGLASQTIEAGALFSLIGRNTPGSFTTGLTAARILIITLKDPAGNVIDKCIRTRDTGDYAITDKSFSRVPDGTGDFYFTTPTPNTANGTSVVGLTRLPDDPPVISNFSRTPSSVTPTDTVTVSATVTTTTSAISTVVLQWTLGGTAQTDITMTASGNVYSAVIPAQAVGSVVTYKVSTVNNLDEAAVTETQNYTVVSAPVDYSKLVLNEVSGGQKFVEIYNSGSVAIPLQGVKLQRNDGASEWVGTASDSIPAGAYRIFLFDSYTAGLDTNPAYAGWKVSSGISDQQILKVAIVDPAGSPVSVFIRGDAPLPAWGNSSSITRDQTHSYSRMSDDTWAYADPTPGAANGAKTGEIVSPGYLTVQP
jgi:hypothetical protein